MAGLVRAIHVLRHDRKQDVDARIKPGHDGGYSFASSRRVAPEVCWNSYALSKIRGRRECRMRAAPAISCAMCTRSARMSIQGSGEHPTFPAQWLYGL